MGGRLSIKSHAVVPRNRSVEDYGRGLRSNWAGLAWSGGWMDGRRLRSRITVELGGVGLVGRVDGRRLRSRITVELSGVGLVGRVDGWSKIKVED